MKRFLALAATIFLGTILGYSQVRINEVLATSTTQKNDAGRTVDVVELYNASATAYDLSNHSLSDSGLNTRKFVFPDGSMIPGFGFFVVELDPANTNNNFGLKANGDIVHFFGPGGNLLHFVRYGLQVTDLAIGAVPDGSDTWTATVLTPGAANTAQPLAGSPFNLRVNEWGARGTDFIEIYNPGSLPVAIGGLWVTDNLSVLKNQFPALSFIGTGKRAYLRLYADDNTSLGADHVSFKLSADGEAVGLFVDAGTLIDGLSFGPQIDKTSQGRLPDGSTNIVTFDAPSPGARNFATITNVVVNELLAHTDPPLEDAIEFLNLTDQPLDISGWYLSDQFDDLTRYRIPDNSVIPAGGLLVFYQYQFGAEGVGNPTEPIRWNSAQGGTVFLSMADAEGEIIAYLSRPFFASENGVSFGRIVTSDGKTDFVPMECRSFGMDYPKTVGQFRTGRGRPNDCGPKLAIVSISELMYQPPPLAGSTNDNTIDEFVELRNLTTRTIPLHDPAYPTNGWELRGGVDYKFNRNHSIPASGFLLLVNFDALNPDLLGAFRQKYSVPSTVTVLGPYSRNLANGGEKLELFRPDRPQGVGRPDQGFTPFLLVDRVTYSDKAPWPGDASGSGRSIQRFGSYYGNDPTSWKSDAPSAGGVTTVQPLTITEQPENTAALTNQAATFDVVASGEGLLYQWYFKNKPLAGATRSTLTIPVVTTRTAGDYFVVVRNDAGSMQSAVARLTAVKPVIIKSKPLNKQVVTGKPVTLRVAATGTAPLSYEWYWNGSRIEGQTGKVLKVIAVPAGSNEYSVVVRNVLSSATLTHTIVGQ